MQIAALPLEIPESGPQCCPCSASDRYKATLWFLVQMNNLFLLFFSLSHVHRQHSFHLLCLLRNCLRKQMNRYKYLSATCSIFLVCYSNNSFIQLKKKPWFSYTLACPFQSESLMQCLITYGLIYSGDK